MANTSCHCSKKNYNKSMSRYNYIINLGKQVMFVKIQKHLTPVHKFNANTDGDEMSRECGNTHERIWETYLPWSVRHFWFLRLVSSMASAYPGTHTKYCRKMCQFIIRGAPLTTAQPKHHRRVRNISVRTPSSDQIVIWVCQNGKLTERLRIVACRLSHTL